MRLSASRRGIRRAQEWLLLSIVVFAAYCLISNIRFLSRADGSFLMYRAAEVRLVSDDYARKHLDRIVWFARNSDGSWEYRVALSFLGYAYIPWVNSTTTQVDLGTVCDWVDPHGNHGCKHS